MFRTATDADAFDSVRFDDASLKRVLNLPPPSDHSKSSELMLLRKYRVEHSFVYLFKHLLQTVCGRVKGKFRIIIPMSLGTSGGKGQKSKRQWVGHQT